VVKKSLVVAAAAVVLVAAGAVVTQQAFAAEAPVYHPTRLAHVGDARQLIVVTGVSIPSTYSTLRTYQLGANGTWSERYPAMAARNGYAGWAWYSVRKQDTGTTPAGTFPITWTFGVKGNPGTKMYYRKVDGNDYWVGDNKDAKTYNLFQPTVSAKRTWRTGEGERLAAYPVQYEYAAMIDFNRPPASSLTWNAKLGEYTTNRPADVRRGSAIFLHVNGKGSTAGCVSVARADMIKVLQWLDPAMKPRIVMAPEGSIGKA
jgi:L,D-peptidoglycan transpeptidase YkuD (ErfK/YbiS/YcfS/YnhG family)